MSRQEIVHAYRRLYRGLLIAVRYSAPARYVARDQLRRAFRSREAVWDPEGAKRTAWFIEAAGRDTGFEHRILRNLLRMAYARQEDAKRMSWSVRIGRLKKGEKKLTAHDQAQKTAYAHFEETLAMLNKTLGTKLR